MKRKNEILAAAGIPALAVMCLAGCSAGSASLPAAESSAAEETEAVIPEEESVQTETETAEAAETGLKGMLLSLHKTGKELGIVGKYRSPEDIEDSVTDPGLIGIWKTADGNYTLEYHEDGTVTDNSGTEMQYACTEAEGQKLIVQQETGASDENDFGITEVLAYRIEGDVLYAEPVDGPYEPVRFASNLMYVFYRDGASSPVTVSSLYGEWETAGGTLVIDENGLSVQGGPEELAGPFPADINADGNLEVGIGGSVSVYPFVIGYECVYTEEQEPADFKYSLTLNYYGTDENDKPNLADIMESYNGMSGYDAYSFYLYGTVAAE
ncbi:MAG: hypothetical protein K6G61_07925 [Solobacterium sp.]|nr:hypothetical protein [Solobacterium sp.]